MLGEAILLSRIGHPNIVRVFDAKVFDAPKGTCGYFTMENVSGGSLDRCCQSDGAALIPIPATIEIVRQVCRGLSVAHSESPLTIHRNIHPDPCPAARRAAKTCGVFRTIYSGPPVRAIRWVAPLPFRSRKEATFASRAGKLN
jgi:hypothetical protein